jgi:hypothetical protein
MSLYPEHQKKAQEELDNVLQGRLPEFKDRHFLPHVNALVKETMRWHPVTPMGMMLRFELSHPFLTHLRFWPCLSRRRRIQRVLHS